jgi:hypothetical protein
MKIYISGKMTGLKREEYVRNFDDAALFLGKVLPNCDILNPLYFEIDGIERTWEEWMKIDIAALMDCDAIFLQNNWKNSKGAKLEYYIAKKLGYKAFKKVKGKLKEI